MRRLLAIGLLGLTFSAFAQLRASVGDPAAMAATALGMETGWASVALWRDGKLAVAGAQRVPAPDPGPLQAIAATGPAPLYEIGSLSKVFTGLLLAQAVERGDLALDDTLEKLLRGKLQFASRQVAAITLRQLITHTACLPRQFGAPRDLPAIIAQLRKADRVDLMAALEQQQLTSGAPCPTLYSNYGIALVGELLSEHYGKSWDALVHERITEPLGMRDTLQHLGEQSARLVPGYSGAAPASPWLMDAYAGAGGLRSSVQDLVTFGRAILAGSKGPLGPAAERMVTPLADYRGMEIGYAIFIHGPPGRRTYSHDGLTGGYRAQLALAPDSGEVLAALVSNTQAPLQQMAQDWWAQRYPVSDKAIAVDAQALESLVGVYRVDPELSFIATVHDQQLYVRARGNVFRAYLPVAADSFTRPAGGARIVFERSGGAVTGLTLEQAGIRRVARRSDEPVAPGEILPQGKAQDYVGRYAVTLSSGSVVEFTIRSDAGQLMVRSNRFPWEPVLPLDGKADRFRYDVPNAQLQFERDATGRVNALVLHQRGELRAPRVYPGS